MDTSNPREGWEIVGNQFYRKVRVYEAVFDQDIELENYVVVGAPYSGAIGKTTFQYPIWIEASINTG